MKEVADSAGYTLAEMLVALLIVGLTMGGLVQAGALIGRLQDHARQHVAGFERGRRVQLAFADLMAGRGPFRSSSTAFDGDATGFRFDCGEAVCGARLVGDRLELNTPSRSLSELGGRGARHFEYVGTLTTGDIWPPEGHLDQRLTAVNLIGGSADADGAGAAAGASPIASASIWRQEEVGCQFDVIAKDCRSVTP